MKEVKLKDFQYKVTNKILVTKFFLHRINKIDNNLCEYCQLLPETILHLFVECEKVKIFWNNLKIKEVKLKDFQYKVTNKILVTKFFLHRINKVDNNLCEYCQLLPETILHLFVECEKVKIFWNNLKIWLKNNANIDIILENKNILFAYQDNNLLKSYIMVLAKN